MNTHAIKALVAISALGPLGVASAAEYAIIGGATTWTNNWVAVQGVSDAVDGGVARLDFVGDASTPVMYTASDATSVYFRMRVAAPSFAAESWSDSVFVMIDRVGFDKTGAASAAIGPDFAIAWDSKSADVTKHGLEMMAIQASGAEWKKIQFMGVDGTTSSKGANDINGGGRTTDGYVRLVDGQPGGAFGTTSFIDFKIAWSYLEGVSGTGLARDQNWRLICGAINNATNEGFISEDVFGALTDNPTLATSWSTATVIPESGYGWAACALASAGAVKRARRPRVVAA